MKKLVSLILSIMMISVCVIAIADGTNNYSGDSQTNITAGGPTIPLTKTIVFFNQDGKDVYEPNISFSYAVAPDTSVPAYGTDRTNNDPTITDSNYNVARVFSGPTDGVTGSLTLSFQASNSVISNVPATGKEVTKSGNLTFDSTKFQHPGVYRYTITETVANSTTPEAQGLEARTNAYDSTRYLDVYVRNASGGGLEMYGAVIYKKIGSTDANPEKKSITASTTGKTTGYEPDVATTSGTADYTADHTVDRYTTYNVTVSKTVSGSLGDKNNQFPFKFEIANSITGAKYSYQKGSNTAVATTDTTINSSLDTTLTLKDGESFVIYGVPSNQTTDLTVTVTEKNNTYDTYKVKMLEGTNTVFTETQVSAGNNAAGNAWTMKQTGEMKTIAVTNTLTEISPTGYVSRFAPYALILVGGIVLLIIAMKRKGHKEEE